MDEDESFKEEVMVESDALPGVSRFSVLELLLTPLLVIVCVGFVVGAKDLPNLLIDDLIAPSISDAPRLTVSQTANRIALRAGFLEVYIQQLLTYAMGFVSIAALCYSLGRMRTRAANFLATATIIAIPMAAAIGAYYLRRLVESSASSVLQVVGVEITAIAVCTVAWLLGYRRKSKAVRGNGRSTYSLRIERTLFVLAVATMVLISFLGWGTLWSLRDMSFENGGDISCLAPADIPQSISHGRSFKVEASSTAKVHVSAICTMPTTT